MSDTKPQTLGFGVQGLSNISLGTESSAKFMPLVTAVDRDRSNSIDQHQCGYWCGMYYPQLSDNTLDKLAIKIPKLIRFALTYGVMLMMIVLGSVYVSDCNKAPELSVMTIIMGTLYAVCWVIRGNTETGKLPKIVKSVCYTVSACAFVVLTVALFRAFFTSGYYSYREHSCSPGIIAPASIFVFGATFIVVKLKVFDPVSKVLNSRKTYTGIFY